MTELVAAERGAGAVGQAPLVMHLIYRFDLGGLENGVVNLINRLPRDAFRHVVVALTEVDPAFARRIERSDVQLIALHKPPGHGLALYPRLWRLFRELRPQILHTRNLAALECQVPAALAGVPVRLHGEHGRDAADPQGHRKRFQWVRRLYRPFVHHYIALSRDLADYLHAPVGIPRQHVSQIYNGVDDVRFSPPSDGRVRAPLSGSPFNSPDFVVIGTVGRMSPEKDQLMLAKAFVRLVQQGPELRARVRLVLVGAGVLQEPVRQVLQEAGLADLAWLAGARADVPDVMRALDVFVLPSLAEGISNTILEAMATARPVVATRVGGNADLVVDGQTGLLVDAGDPSGLAEALSGLVRDPDRRQAMGEAGRMRVRQQFSLQAMVAAYQQVYESQLRRGH